MQPNEFILGFVLLALVYGGWRLVRFARSRSKLSQIAGTLSGSIIVVLSGCLLLLYGCGMVLKYRSVPSYSPNGKYMAQVTELDFGAVDMFHTTVELYSRWHFFPKAVFTSYGDPREVEVRWLSDSQVVIRYASGFRPNQAFPSRCAQHFKTVNITCEPVEGYRIHPN